MNHIRWVAWGTIDVDGTMDRQQRRNYLRKIRAELTEIRCGFTIGGNKRTPWYGITYTREDGAQKRQACAGTDALKKVCAWLLLEVGDHERGADGGVRSAGAEGDQADGDGITIR